MSCLVVEARVWRKASKMVRAVMRVVFHACSFFDILVWNVQFRGLVGLQVRRGNATDQAHLDVHKLVSADGDDMFQPGTLRSASQCVCAFTSWPMGLALTRQMHVCTSKQVSSRLTSKSNGRAHDRTIRHDYKDSNDACKEVQKPAAKGRQRDTPETLEAFVKGAPDVNKVGLIVTASLGHRCGSL